VRDQRKSRRFGGLTKQVATHHDAQDKNARSQGEHAGAGDALEIGTVEPDLRRRHAERVW
jgi:hypothetical protein